LTEASWLMTVSRAWDRVASEGVQAPVCLETAARSLTTEAGRSSPATVSEVGATVRGTTATVARPVDTFSRPGSSRWIEREWRGCRPRLESLPVRRFRSTGSRSRSTKGEFGCKRRHERRRPSTARGRVVRSRPRSPRLVSPPPSRPSPHRNGGKERLTRSFPLIILRCRSAGPSPFVSPVMVA
jgi:hypothetical protein